ncbi:hypothetical protein MBLNU457_5609t1 [Dothideomycetes sp. NU457]
MDLFGGNEKWDTEDWTASDDRSYFEKSGSCGHFYGTLDIKTLGGAGFASQRTTGEDRKWSLSKYDGITVKLDKADGKKYTLILKDELLPRNPDNGREQATISYEYDFDTKASSTVGADPEVAEQKFFIPWSDFKPTYRGKEKKDAQKLDTSNIQRISIMMRSFFGSQEGPFSVTVRSIAASKKPTHESSYDDLEKALSQLPPDALIHYHQTMHLRQSQSATSPWIVGLATIVTFAAVYVVYERFADGK